MSAPRKRPTSAKAKGHGARASVGGKPARSKKPEVTKGRPHPTIGGSKPPITKITASPSKKTKPSRPSGSSTTSNRSPSKRTAPVKKRPTPRAEVAAKPTLPLAPFLAARLAPSTPVAEPSDAPSSHHPVEVVGRPAPETAFPRSPSVHVDREPGRLRRPRTALRAWMTDRRAVTLSLIPIVALVVLVGISVTTAVVGGGSTITATPPSVPAPAPASSSAQGDAADWLATNAGDGGVVIVDAPMASELFLAGWPSADILTVGEDATAPWREAAYVVSSAGIRDAVGEDPNVAAALLNSVAVARFGDENAGTQVRRITPEGVTAAAIAEGQATAEHREFGGQLSRNPALIVSTPDRVAFAGGRVDSRISLVIGALVATGSVTVNDLPVVPGESGEVLRTVAISAVGDTPLVNDGAPTAQAAEVFEGLSGAYAVDDLTVRGDALVLTFPLLSPSNP